MADRVFNNMWKSSVVKMISALTVVGVISGATLVFIYKYSFPKIQMNIKTETEKAVKNIFPQTANIEKTDMEGVSRVLDSDKKLLGYVFLAEGNGYQGAIKLIVGVDTKLSTMKGMEVLESQETPGLGAEIAGDKFRSQFAGLPLTHAIEYVKNEKPQKPYQIEAITGATISSRAVVNILNKRIKEVRKGLK